MDILLVVDSMTGQGKRFAEKMGFPVEEIHVAKPKPQQSVFLITRSYNFGQVPDTTQTFLSLYHQHVIGVAVGGNRTWGQHFGAAGDKIQQQYGIPLIQKFEGTGFPHEVKHVQTWLKNYVENHH
jgi:ribonucleoside-diphosphate reductase protein NrdI